MYQPSQLMVYCSATGILHLCGTNYIMDVIIYHRWPTTFVPVGYGSDVHSDSLQQSSESDTFPSISCWFVVVKTTAASKYLTH